MSRNGTLLPIPDDDPRFAALIAGWPENLEAHPAPRSAWLSQFERLLHQHYPSSSSADRKLTARHVAPFYLSRGPNVV